MHRHNLQEVVAALRGVSSNGGVGSGTLVKSFFRTYKSHGGKVDCSTLKACAFIDAIVIDCVLKARDTSDVI